MQVKRAFLRSVTFFTFGLAATDAFPQSGKLVDAGSMTRPRVYHSATLLQNGRVLIAGGSQDFCNPSRPVTSDSAEQFDPDSMSFQTTGRMNSGHMNHTATLLKSGKVLVAGGRTGICGNPTAGAEWYDPVSGSFSVTTSMLARRESHTATLLNTGRVLMVGDLQDVSTALSAEVYDPSTGLCSPTGVLSSERERHTATLLPDGRVLIVGGLRFGDPSPSAEIYDPSRGTFKAVASSLKHHRIDHSAVLLANGKVLVRGGRMLTPSGAHVLCTVEIFDPATETFSITSSMAPVRYGHTATKLRDDQVLAVGGYSDGAGSGSGWTSPPIELFDPARELFRTTSIFLSRFYHTATLLHSGLVLLAGGQSCCNEGKSAAYLYIPPRLVPIDIKPGDARNTVNVKANGKLAVAMVSAGASATAGAFDATTVNPASVALAGASVATQGRGTPLSAAQDVNADGRLDLLLHFNIGELQLAPLASGNTVDAVLYGETWSGELIRGGDTIRLLP